MDDWRGPDGRIDLEKVRAWEEQLNRDRAAASEQIVVYSNGIVHCSACAAKDLTREQVEELVNRLNPSGTTHEWKVSDNSFLSGVPNPIPCNDHPDQRMHWLMVC